MKWEDNRKEWLSRIDYAATLQIPHLFSLNAHQGRCLIAGSAPSLAHQLVTMRQLQDDFSIMISVNGAHDWLIRHGFMPTIHVLFEHDLDTAEMSLKGPPHQGVTYYIASIIRPEIFQQLEGFKRVLFHGFYPIDEYMKYLEEKFPDEYAVCGGLTTLFRALAIAFFLGYRKFDLFGCDCSFLESSHIDGYSLDTEPVIEIYGRNAKDELRKFKTQGGLAFQVKEMLEFCDARRHELDVRVHGDSLLNYVHESRYPEWYSK